MAENQTKEVIERVSSRVKQAWSEVQPQLQAILLKLVKSLLPALLNLQTKLTTSNQTVEASDKVISEVISEDIVNETSGEEINNVINNLNDDDVNDDDIPANVKSNQSAPNNAWDRVLTALKTLSAQAIASLIVGFTKLQHSLEGSEPILDRAVEPIALLDPASPFADLPLAERVKVEFGTAWKFVKEQVTPKVLEFLQGTVDKLDPIASNIWQRISSFAVTTPALVNLGQKVQENDIWKKGLTAIAPIWRSMVNTASQVPLPDRIKSILDKRAGVVALVTLFSLLILLKPSSASSRNIHKIDNPVPISDISQKPSADDLAVSKRSDAPLTAEQRELAKIQAQVSEVTNLYSDNLLISVQANPKDVRLIVTLTDAWYEIEADRQKQLVTDLQNQSRSLNFKKILIADSANHVVARNAVTGDGVIILRR